MPVVRVGAETLLVDLCALAMQVLKLAWMADVLVSKIIEI